MQIQWKWKLLSHVQLWDPMDYTVHGILQARIMGLGSHSLLQGIFKTKDWTQVSYIAGGFFTSWGVVSYFRKVHWYFKYVKETKLAIL